MESRFGEGQGQALLSASQRRRILWKFKMRNFWMKHRIKVVVVIGILLGAVGVFAHAVPVHQYSFEITAVNGPLAGTSGTGTFSYQDQGLGGQRVQGMQFTEFEFDWNGRIWSADDVSFGSVWLAPDGSIDFEEISTFLGTSCLVGGCGVTAGQLEWNLEVFGFEIPTYGGSIFRYSNQEASGVANGVVSIEYLGVSEVADNIVQAQSIPEPSTWIMVLAGLLVLRRLRTETVHE